MNSEEISKLDATAEEVSRIARTVKPEHRNLPPQRLSNRRKNQYGFRTSWLVQGYSAHKSRQAVHQRTFAFAVFCVALMMGVFTGAASASIIALPGEPLYPIKTGLEALPVALSPNPTETADLEMNLYQRRLQEIENLVAFGKYSSLPTALQQFEKAAEKLTSNLDQLQEQGNPEAIQIAIGFDAALEPHIVALNNLIEIAPSSATPTLKRALTVSTRQREQIQKIIQ